MNNKPFEHEFKGNQEDISVNGIISKIIGWGHEAYSMYEAKSATPNPLMAA